MGASRPHLSEDLMEWVAVAMFGAATGAGLFLASPFVLGALTIVAIGMMIYFWATASHHGVACFALLAGGCFLIPMWLVWALLQCTHCG